MLRAEQPASWYLNNYEPLFSCPDERRMGGVGDGPKWVCNPHRLDAHAQQDDRECIIYSIGSKGKYQFEDAMRHETNCTIHVFDPGSYDQTQRMGPNVHYHQWGLGPSNTSASYEPQVDGGFISLQETLKRLNHTDKIIDAFKIDCEDCEWYTYRDWVESDVDIRQILVETHFMPTEQTHGFDGMDFFDYLQDHNYLMFHKEPNINPVVQGRCVEFAYIKLHSDFLRPGAETMA